MQWQFVFISLIIFFTVGAGAYFIKRYKFATHFQAFGWILVSAALWSLGMIGFLVAQTDSLALFWLEVGHVGGLWIGLWLFYFAYVFPPSRPRPHFLLRWLLGFGFIFSIFLLWPGNLLIGITHASWGRDAFFVSESVQLFSAALLCFWLFGVAIFYKRYKKAEDKISRRQLAYIFWGVILGSSPGLVFNVFLTNPLAGQQSQYFWLGPISGVLIAIAISFALYKNYLFHPKVLIGEIFAFCLVLFAAGSMLFAGSIVETIWQFIILVFTAIFGFFLVRSILQEVQRLEKTRELKKLLDDANWKLKELEHSKNDFLSIASHQLRTPLSVIKGYISLLSDGDYGELDKKTTPILNNIAYSIERLMHLVDQFLDLSQIESGKMQFEFTRTEMNILIEHVTNELKSRLPSKIKMSFVNEAKNKVFAEMDGDKIVNVIFNFVDNAIKYTEKGTIKIILRDLGDKVAVSVVDTGIGLSVEDKEKVFSKFFRSKDVLTAVGRSGTGLGLYIAAKFVAGHKGDIWCDSLGKDKGSEFGFSVPVKQELKATQVAA